MTGDRPGLFRGRHFADEVIIICVRWYPAYSLSYRDLSEMMAERKLSVDPSTIWRWVQCYAPELNARIRRGPEIRTRVIRTIKRAEDRLEVAARMARIFEPIELTAGSS